MNSLYLETTVPSYLVGRPSRDLIVASHQNVTREWWNCARFEYDMYVSQLVLDEIGAGDPEMVAERENVVKGIPILRLTAGVENLALQYARELGIPARALTDAYHLAFAVAYELDYLLTWNCAHLANGDVRLRVQKWNVSRGLHLPVIVTPEELMPSRDSSPDLGA